MRASFSMLGQAHSSPMVSGATVWKPSRKRASCCRSRRLSLWRIELHGQRVDPGVAGQVAGRELGQLPVVAARQVLPDHPDLGVDQVVVVEEPLAGRRDELAPVHVVGERAVGIAQETRVVVEAGEDAARHAPGRDPP